MTGVQKIDRGERAPLEAEAPGDDVDVLGEAHGAQHLGAEHAGVAHLHPLAQLLAVGEDLHRRLRVGVEGRLEAQLGQAQATEEQVQRAYQVTQRQAPVAHHACTTCMHA